MQAEGAPADCELRPRVRVIPTFFTRTCPMVSLLLQPQEIFASSAWFDRGVLLAVVLAGGVALSLNLADPDLWGHVQYGRDVLNHGLPATTTYSYIAAGYPLSLIHISEPTRLLSISYAVFCLKKK